MKEIQVTNDFSIKNKIYNVIYKKEINHGFQENKFKIQMICSGKEKIQMLFTQVGY